MLSKSSKFLIASFIVFLLTFFIASSQDISPDIYEEELIKVFQNHPDALSTSSDYKNGYLKYKEMFVPVPINSPSLASTFIYNFFEKANYSSETTSRVLHESKLAISSSHETSKKYLSDSVFLSNGNISLCLINLRADHNYKGLKAIALEHEMGHCYLEAKGISSVYDHLFSASEQQIIYEIFKFKVGPKDVSIYMEMFKSFLTESYVDGLAIYKLGGGSHSLKEVINDRHIKRTGKANINYATDVSLSRLSFDYTSIEEFESHLESVLSSPKLAKLFLDEI